MLIEKVVFIISSKTKKTKIPKYKQIPYDLICMWNLNKPNFIDKENKLVVARGGLGVGKIVAESEGTNFLL